MTVLFADIVGFTGLSEMLDPEEVKHLTDRAFERLALDITSFGGIVDKIIGDGIVALFGAPVAHEDDAERAVRAGLAMQQTMMTLGADLETPVRMRIGINTGEVLVGTSAAGGDYTAMGDVMNSASRLESMADPGQVLVAEATHAATCDAISYRFVGELPAKGRVEVIRSWAALSPIRPPGGRTRRATPFVGRESELALIHAQAKVAMELGRSQATLIVGEAGMGKTRIVQEAAAMIAAEWDARIFEGRSVPYGEANVWWPIAEIVRQAFNLRIDTSSDDARVTISRLIFSQLPEAGADDIDRYTTALMHALGHATRLRGGDRTRNRTEVMLATTTVLGSVVHQRPAVVVLSDMHWAHDAVWALILHMLQELWRAPLIILMTARSGEMPSARDPRYGSLVLQLGPLGAESSKQLVDQLGIALPADVIDDLLERAGGNPFFLEELAGLVASRTASDSAADSDVVADLRAGKLDSLPGTLRGIISARLDSLELGDRMVLDAAAVLGRHGPIDGLARLLAATKGIDNIEPSLVALVEGDLIEIEGSRYSFSSHLVRDVAYGTLTKTARALSHHGIAAYLLEVEEGNDRRNSAVVAIATHLFAAAELVNELSDIDGIGRSEVNADAITWLEEAGQRAFDAGVPIEAEKWYSQGLSIAADDQTRARFLHGRARSRSERRDVVGTRADLDRLDPLVVGDALLSARSLMVRGDINRKAGDVDRAASQLREASARFESLGARTDQSLALRMLGLTEAARGDDRLAEQALQSARSVAAEAGDKTGEAWAIQSLGTHAFQQGHVQEAGEFVELAADLFRQIDDRGGLTFTRGLEAWVAFHSGDWARARELIDDVLPETQRRGDPWAEAVMLQLQASLQLWNGESVLALETARLALNAAERADDVSLQVACRGLEGRALVSRARIPEAIAALETAFALADAAGHDQARRAAAVINASSAARIGEGDRAVRSAARFNHSHDDGALLGETDLIVSLTLALLQQGKLDEAKAQIAWLDPQAAVGSYPLAAKAILASVTHEFDEAERAVAQVLAGQSTYLDRVFALGARAAVHHQMGDFVARDQSFREAFEILASTDDILTPRFLTYFQALCNETGVDVAEDRLRAIGVEPSGWRRVWAFAANRQH